MWLFVVKAEDFSLFIGSSEEDVWWRTLAMTTINQGNSDSSMKLWLLAIGGVVTLFGASFCVLSCVVPDCQEAAGWLAAVF